MSLFQSLLLLILGVGVAFIAHQLQEVVRLFHEAVRLLEEIRLHVKMTRQVTHEFRRLMYDSLVDVDNDWETAKLYKLVRER